MFGEAQRKIEEFAKKKRIQFTLQTFTSDRSVLSGKLSKGKVEIEVYLVREGDEYFAYDITSIGLPNELYMDSPQHGTSTKQRSQEIVANVKKLLVQEIRFNSKPSVLNKNAGFIILPIDGKDLKIYQKNNYFQLTLASEKTT